MQVETLAVADPEFPKVGAPTLQGRGGANI